MHLSNVCNPYKAFITTDAICISSFKNSILFIPLLHCTAYATMHSTRNGRKSNRETEYISGNNNNKEDEKFNIKWRMRNNTKKIHNETLTTIKKKPTHQGQWIISFLWTIWSCTLLIVGVNITFDSCFSFNLSLLPLVVWIC